MLQIYYVTIVMVTLLYSHKYLEPLGVFLQRHRILSSLLSIESDHMIT